MGPGVRRKELVMVLHALAQIERHAVVDRTAIGEVASHVAERYWNANSQVVLVGHQGGQPHARSKHCGQRRIDSRFAEEAQQRWGNKSACRTYRARIDGKRV